MSTHVESDVSSNSESRSAPQSGWAKLGLIAMASVVLGGMATAWWYRKTLIRLRQAEENSSNPQFGMTRDDPGDEL
jgi:hypothetical protein